MTGTVINATVRRATTLVGATATLLVAAALLAGPASAKVPVGWGPEHDVDPLFVLGVLVAVPIGLFVLIAAAVYLPGAVRGENLAPGATGPEDQWLGGRRHAGEIAFTPATTTDDGAPGTDVVETDGGASARW